MRRSIAFALLLLCLSATDGLGRGVWDNPDHKSRPLRILIELPPEYDSLVFMHVQEELEGCLENYMYKNAADRPKTREALDDFVTDAFKKCVQESLAVQRTHDRIFGKGTGAPYYREYIEVMHERMQDFFKIPYVESE